MYTANPQMQDQSQNSEQSAVIKQIAAALQKGAKQEDIIKALVSKGLDEQQATEIVGSIAQQIGQGAQSQTQMAAYGSEVYDLPQYQIGEWLTDVYNTGKKYAGRAVDAVTHTDPVNFIPFGSYLPANAKSFARLAAANVGLGKGVPFVQERDFTREENQAIKNAALNSQKRKGTTKGGVNYSDYGKGYEAVWSNPSTMLTNPNKVVQTTLGRFNYNIDDDGYAGKSLSGPYVNVTDTYNFDNEKASPNANILKRLVHSGLTYIDKGVPANDPRRKVDFSIKKEGGMYKAKDGVSIVDYLNDQNEDSSFAYRKKLAEKYNIKNYRGTAEQNLKLLKTLRGESSRLPEKAQVEKKLGIPSYTPLERERFTSDIPNVNFPVEKIPAKQPVKQTVEKPKEKPKVEEKKQVKKSTSSYIDLQKEYGLDPFSKVGIEKAREISRSNPNARFVCTAEGCSQIASNAAEAYGYDFNRSNAWDLGNVNQVVYQNPVYANQIGKGILPNPTQFTAPAQMYSQPGAIIGLNRVNNKRTAITDVSGMAPIPKLANDSFDYANPKLYPKTRGYEHAGFYIGNNQLLHGTGAGEGHPAYYVIDDVRNGVALPGYGGYQPVEAMTPGSAITKAGNWFSNMLGFQKGGSYDGTYYQGNFFNKGGNIPNYMQDPNPLYYLGGYFPQAPRFKNGGMNEDGGIVVGNVYDATPELLQKLKEGGYKFEYVD